VSSNETSTQIAPGITSEMASDKPAPILLTPIGHVRGSRTRPQDDFWGAEISTIELHEDIPAESLDGLSDFSHIEVVYWFHQVDPKRIETGARHPRNNQALPRIGIFAQRGKNRPNQLGVTIARLLGVKGRTLNVMELDAIDGTPIVDIKPVMSAFLPREEVTEPQWTREIMSNYWLNATDAPQSSGD
jgi:tRNA-Thr(GGU) m(6)t(6)A37 methyltransferase TsaA